MFAWRPPLLMLFLLALGRGLPSSSSAPSSSSSSVPAGGPTYTYLMRDGRDSYDTTTCSAYTAWVYDCNSENNKTIRSRIYGVDIGSTNDTHNILLLLLIEDA